MGESSSVGRQLFRRGAPVRAGQEYKRIQSLPRRVWDPTLAPKLTELLRTPNGQQKLRPLQAQALFEIGELGGLFGPIRVGAGKTLISLLAPRVAESTRPLLLLPAALIEKTKREQLALSRDWRVAKHVRLYSYEMLGRVAAARELEIYKPDLIIADECHKLKNFGAGVTRRVKRYFEAHPETRMVAMSGTIMSKSLHDFAHIAEWCLKDRAPIPLEDNTLEEWSSALDEKIDDYKRRPPGVLGINLEQARKWFHVRLVETPGVVASPPTQDYTGSLVISPVEYAVNRATQDNFETLRTKWETPDGWMLSEAVDVWRHARELCLGLHYLWDPRPPDEWLEARRSWASFVRDYLSRSRTLDTELQVVQAVDSGHIRDGGLLAAWREIKPTFTVNSRPEWHDESALAFCAKWLADGDGICWVEHVFFAEELARRTGRPYFGAEGLDTNGQPIESAFGPVIASIASCGTGRNLQKWNRNLLTTVPDPSRLEQLLGRTHRDGQRADEVTVDVMMGCIEHLEALNRAVSAAKTQEAMLGQVQKLLLADLTVPTIQNREYRWKKTSKT